MKTNYLSAYKSAIFLLTALIFFGHNINYIQAEEITVKDRLISIDMQNQDFTQAMEAIAGQAGVIINLHGEIPAGKRDLLMDQVPMGQAMARVLKMYGVRNHAAAYNPETGTVMLAILETSTMMAALSPETEPRIDLWKDEPLTEEQMDRLREQSEILVAEMEEASLPLTYDQMERLQEQSYDVEMGMDEDQPLTTEQMEKLREHSWQMEMELAEASQPLTAEQLKRLRVQNEAEMKDDQPLTPEQLQRLKEQDQ
jgi:hypothetical protein